MQNWGIRTRESFNGESRFHHDWKKESDKYGLTRRQWIVYQGLLLFYMNSPSLLLLPELVTTIVQRAFSVAIGERMKMICSSREDWFQVKCFASRLNGEPVPDGIVILSCYGAHKRGEKDGDYCAVTNIDIPEYLGGFRCKDTRGNDVYFPERLLNDDWLRNCSSRLYDNKLYRHYLWDTTKEFVTICTLILFCLYDCFVADFSLSWKLAHSFTTAFVFKDGTDTVLYEAIATLVQTVLNPLIILDTTLKVIEMMDPGLVPLLLGMSSLLADSLNHAIQFTLSSLVVTLFNTTTI